MNTKIYRVFLISILFFVIHITAEEQDFFLIDGIAVIEKDDIASARTAAIEDAQKKALNQYISGLIPSDLIVNNYKILEEKIFSKTVDFISSYKVISENREGDIFRIRVEISVTIDALQRALSESGLIFSRGEYPRVLIMIAEQRIDGGFNWWWNRDSETRPGICEDNILQQMKKRGFIFIEPDVVKQKIEGDASAQNMDLSVDTVRRIGRDNGADIVIFGKGLLRKGEDVEGSTLKLYYAKLSLQALYIESGKVILNAGEEAGGLNINPEVSVKNAYKKVSDLLGVKTGDVIEKFWRENVIKARNIYIEIRNPRGLEDVRMVLSAVQKIKNVKRAEIMAFSKGSSLIESEIFNINPESIASLIFENIEDTQRYQVINIKSDRIIIEVKQ